MQVEGPKYVRKLHSRAAHSPLFKKYFIWFICWFMGKGIIEEAEKKQRIALYESHIPLYIREDTE